MPFENELGQRLRKEHSIELTRDEDCTVDEAYVSFVGSYNEEIQKHYGLDIETILNQYLMEIDTLRCNIKVLLMVFQNMDSLADKTIEDFLITFGTECRINAEFSEWSNELLFEVLRRYPAQIVNFLDKNQEIERDVIFEELKSPIHDLIDVASIISSVEKTVSNSNVKNKLLTALKSIELN